MHLSTSQYIGWESVSLSDLFKKQPGSVGLFIPTADENWKFKASIARISSAAKSFASRNGKRCLINTLLVLKQEQDSELPTPSKMVQVVVTSAEDLSPSGKRYVDASR